MVIKMHYELNLTICLLSLFFDLQGIVMTMEKKSTKKIEKLIKLIEKLKAENEQLKEIISEKNSLIESLNKTRKKSSVNDFG